MGSQVLLTLFSQIASPQLQVVEIHFELENTSVRGLDVDAYHRDMLLYTSSLHAALSRNQFDNLRASAVLVLFRFFGGSRYPGGPPSLLSTYIASFMVPLFEPWLSRGIMTLRVLNQIYTEFHIFLEDRGADVGSESVIDSGAA